MEKTWEKGEIQVYKIISLFQRNHGGDHLVRNECVPGAEWVLSGEGAATVKFDGMCCLVRDGKLFKRYELQQGKGLPEDFEPAGEADPVTGKQQDWRPVGDGPGDRWHREAADGGMPPDGTYELVGPKVQGNPEEYENHTLLRHGSTPAQDGPRDFDSIRDYLAGAGIEGIVWHHPDGRMVKIKARDFGIRRESLTNAPRDQGRERGKEPSGRIQE
jgi:hypothetical protein